MKTVNIRFGTQTATRSFTDETTVSQVVHDTSIRAELGYGDSIRALVNSVEASPNMLAPSGGTIVVETRANAKAIAG